MKKLRIPAIVNVFKVRKPEEILALAQNPSIDREFNLRTCPLNWLLLKRSLAVLSFEGRRFPTMTPRHILQRQSDQQNLRNSLNESLATIRTGPEELKPIAQWVQGIGEESEIGMHAQQLLGRLFSPDFVASEESWNAAKILVAAPRSRKILTVVTWFVTGKLKRSKRLLAQMVDGDLSGVNAIGIAVHNIVKSFRHMRTLYEDTKNRGTLTPEEVARQCLFAPVSLYRQAIESGTLGDCPFPKNSLFLFEIGEASRCTNGLPLVFMEGTWSECPASQWVPAMLEGTWRRATHR